MTGATGEELETAKIIDNAKLEERRTLRAVTDTITPEGALEYWKEHSLRHGSTWQIDPSSGKYILAPLPDSLLTLVALHQIHSGYNEVLNGDAESQPVTRLEKAFAVARIAWRRRGNVPNDYHVGGGDMYELARRAASHGEEELEGTMDVLARNVVCYESDPELKGPKVRWTLMNYAVKDLGFGGGAPRLLPYRLAKNILKSHETSNTPDQSNFSRLFAARIVDRYMQEPDMDKNTAGKLLDYLAHAPTKDIRDVTLDVFEEEAFPIYLDTLQPGTKALNFSPVINALLMNQIAVAAKYDEVAQRVQSDLYAGIHEQQRSVYKVVSTDIKALPFKLLTSIAESLTTKYNQAAGTDRPKLVVRPLHQGVEADYADSIATIAFVVGESLRTRFDAAQMSQYDHGNARITRLLECHKRYMEVLRGQQARRAVGGVATMKAGVLPEIQGHGPAFYKRHKPGFGHIS